jgi:hypothetical protein
MNRQVNRTEGLAIAAVVLPVIAAFIGLSAPRAVPLGRDVPAPVVSARAVAAAERADLRLIEGMRDAPALQVMDRAFGDLNQSEGSPAAAGGGEVFDGARALRFVRSAWVALTRQQRRQFLAERSERFLQLVHKVRRVVAKKREAPEEAQSLRMLVGGRFEDRAVQSGLIDAEDVVLRAAFKLRLVLAVRPDDVELVPRVERIAFFGFIASRARGQSVNRRLEAVEQIGRLDRAYPVHVAAAQLLAMAGEWSAAVERLQRHPHPTVRTRNHLLWLARKQG